MTIMYKGMILKRLRAAVTCFLQGLFRLLNSRPTMWWRIYPAHRLRSIAEFSFVLISTEAPSPTRQWTSCFWSPEDGFVFLTGVLGGMEPSTFTLAWPNLRGLIVTLFLITTGLARLLDTFFDPGLEFAADVKVILARTRFRPATFPIEEVDTRQGPDTSMARMWNDWNRSCIHCKWSIVHTSFPTISCRLYDYTTPELHFDTVRQ